MEPPSPHRPEIIDESGLRPPTEALLAVMLDACSALDLPPGEIVIKLTGPEEIRRLNQAFRGIDAPTDVLTFPAAEIPVPAGVLPPLGDVVISVPQAIHQAEARGYGLESELAYLGLHGLLHLAGFEDESDEDRQAMLEKMDEMGRSLGLPPFGEWHTLAPAGAAR